MKKALSLLLVVALAMPAPSAFAILGAGDIVSDPTSYTYYAAEIAAIQKQVVEAQKQVETLGGIKTIADKAQRAVVGNYNRGKAIVGDLQRIRKKLEATPTTLQGIAKKWLTLGNSGLEIGEDGFIAVGKILDTTWIDPRDLKRNVERLKKLDQIYQVKQASLRGNIEASDEILRAMPERLKKIEDLAEQIDQTDNIKDAMDLNNRFQAEILKVLVEMTGIAAKIGESYALLNYQGMSETTSQQRAQPPSGGSSGQQEGWAARDLRKKGYDPENMTGKDFRKMMNVEE